MLREELIDKGNREMRRYMNSIAGEMDRRTRRRLFKLIENNYRKAMENDKYFEEMESFLTRRKSAEERTEFFHKKVGGLLKGVREEYARLYPEDYQLESSAEETESDFSV